MKIVIDGRMIGWTGVGRYTIELLNELQKLDGENHYVVLMLRADEEKWQPTSDSFTVKFTNIPPYSFREQLVLPFVLWRFKPDLVHFIAPNIPIFYFGRHITTIHDLTLLRFKNVQGGSIVYSVKMAAFRLAVTVAARYSAHVLTPSEYVKQAVYETFSRETDTITATPLGAPPVQKRVAGKKPAKPSLLYVGNYYPYKNVGNLIRAFPDILHRHPGCRLILAGNPGVFADDLRKLAEEMGVSHQVDWLGYVSDERLAELYTSATLLVYPSLSEGFGLQGLEAMATGLPVAASKASCLPEVYGNAAIYFDPHSPCDMAEVISSVLGDQKRLDGLTAAGYRQVKKYSWEKTATQTLAIYNQILD